jgi:hypothetical protein
MLIRLSCENATESAGEFIEFGEHITSLDYCFLSGSRPAPSNAARPAMVRGPSGPKNIRGENADDPEVVSQPTGECPVRVRLFC